jgi:hypothetical protein
MPRDAMTAPERLAQEPCAPQAARNAARAGRRGLPPCTARRPAARRGPSRAPPPEAPADWYVRYRKAIDTHGPQEQTYSRALDSACLKGDSADTMVGGRPAPA